MTTESNSNHTSINGSGLRRLYVAVAGDTKDDLPSEIWQLLSYKGFAERKSVNCVGFCRDTQKNRLVVVLPKAYSSPEIRKNLNENSFVRDHVYQLIRIFARIAKETKYKQELIESDSPGFAKTDRSDPILDSLEAALKLRVDFRKNGLYYSRTRRDKFNTPHLPLNWKKTLSAKAPVLTSSDEVIFQETVHSMRVRDERGLLYRLHVQCLKDIFSLIGEKDDVGDVIGLVAREYERIKRNPRTYLVPLNRTVFDDRGRRILRTIEAYLNESRLKPSSNIESDNLLSYTSVFEKLWEYILRSVFGSSDKDRSLKHGWWVRYSDKQKFLGITPIIDLHIDTEQYEVLLDAKDYRIFNGSYLSTAGSSSDHYKQIIYRRLMEHKSDKGFHNILAFPGFNQETLLQLRGCHYWQDLNDSIVYEIGIDYNLVVQHWMGEIRIDIESALTLLIDRIEELYAGLSASV